MEDRDELQFGILGNDWSGHNIGCMLDAARNPNSPARLGGSVMNAIERIKKLEARIEELERVLFEIYHYQGNTPGGILNLIHAVLTKRPRSQRVANGPTGKNLSSC